jgi:glutathione peroxidase-family protein
MKQNFDDTIESKFVDDYHIEWINQSSLTAFGSPVELDVNIICERCGLMSLEHDLTHLYQSMDDKSFHLIGFV